MADRRMGTWLCLAAVVAVLCIAPCTPAVAQNLLVNGDFSTGDFTGWQFIPEYGADARAFIDTQYAWYDPGDGGTSPPYAVVQVDGGALLRQFVDLQQGYMYELTGGVGVYGWGGSPGTSQISVYMYDVYGMAPQDALWQWTVQRPFDEAFDWECFALEVPGLADCQYVLDLYFWSNEPLPDPPESGWTFKEGVHHFADDLALRVTQAPEPDPDDSPEPATWVLLACTGVVGLLRRRKR